MRNGTQAGRLIRVVTLHRLTAGAMILGSAVGGLLTACARSAPRPDTGTTAATTVFLLAAVVLIPLVLRVSRGAELRRYTEAIPLPEPDAVFRAEVEARRQAARRAAGMAALTALIVVVPVVVFGSTSMMALLFCYIALLMLLRTRHIARWERRTGTALWQDYAGRGLPALFSTPLDATARTRG